MRSGDVRARLAALAGAVKPSRGDVGAVLVVLAVGGLLGFLAAALTAGVLLLASEALD